MTTDDLAAPTLGELRAAGVNLMAANLAANMFSHALKAAVERERYLLDAHTIGVEREHAERVLGEVIAELATTGGDPARAYAIANGRLADPSCADRAANRPIVDDGFPPNGCAGCGRFERGHPDGRYAYVAPSDALRLARMKARREARLNPARRPTPSPATLATFTARVDDWTDAIRYVGEALGRVARPAETASRSMRALIEQYGSGQPAVPPMRRPPGTEPPILVDGPSAGQVHHIPESAGAWNVPDPRAVDFTAWLNPYSIYTTYTTYQVRRFTLCYPLDDDTPQILPLHLGVCGGVDPDEATLLRHVAPALERLGWLSDPLRRWISRRIPPAPTIDRPIRILEQGTPPGHRYLWCCDATVRLHQERGAMQGFCRCGWLTETVPRRRASELMNLADQHRESSRVTQTYRPSPESTVRDEDWPAPTGTQTCAHVCGPDPGHACDARATTTLRHALPSGGTRELPLCGPCHLAEPVVEEG